MKIKVKEFKSMIEEAKKELAESKTKVVKVGPTQLKKMVESFAGNFFKRNKKPNTKRNKKTK